MTEAIEITKKQHAVQLYRDHVILFLSNPVNIVPAINKILNHFQIHTQLFRLIFQISSPSYKYGTQYAAYLKVNFKSYHKLLWS